MTESQASFATAPPGRSKAVIPKRKVENGGSSVPLPTRTVRPFNRGGTTPLLPLREIGGSARSASPAPSRGAKPTKAADADEGSDHQEEYGEYQKWRKVHHQLMSAPVISIKGCSGHWSSSVNGTYIVDKSYDDEPPSFVKVGHPNIWLYYGTDCSWRISGAEHARRRSSGPYDGFARSSRVEPGRLPFTAKSWDVCITDRVYKPQNTLTLINQQAGIIRLSMPRGKESEIWRYVKTEIQATPALKVSGASGDKGTEINGRYVIQAGPQDSPPLFKKVDDEMTYIFYADKQWNIGWMVEDKAKTIPLFAYCSSRVGQLPHEGDWYVKNGNFLLWGNWEQQPSFTIQPVNVASHVAAMLAMPGPKEKNHGKSAPSKAPERIMQKDEYNFIPKLQGKKVNADKLGKMLLGMKLNAGNNAMIDNRVSQVSEVPRMARMKMDEGVGDAAHVDPTVKPLAEIAQEFVPEKSCEQYMREDLCKIQNIGENCAPLLETLIDSSMSIVKEKVEEGLLKKHKGLTEEHAFAVVVFTLELGLLLAEDEEESLNYPGHECEFYRQYNQAVRKRDPKAQIHLAGYSHFLFSALKVLPKYDGVLWRGIWEPEAIEMAKGNYQPRMKEVHWSSFSSATPDKEVALNFAGEEGLLFRIETYQAARDIRDLSALDEDERLVLPNTKFIVDQVAKWNEEDQVYEIHLVEAVGSYTF